MRRIVPTFPRAKYYAPEGEWQYARKPSERDTISYIPENYDPLVESGQMTLLKGGEEIVPGISVKTFRGHTACMQAIIVQSPSGAEAPVPGMPNGTAEAVPFPNPIPGTPKGMAEAVRHPNQVLEIPRQNPHFSQKQGEMGHPASSHSGSSYMATACYISDLMPTTAHIDLTWGMGFDLYPLDTIESKKEYYARALPEKWLTVFTHDPNVPWAYIEKDESGKMVAREVA